MFPQNLAATKFRNQSRFDHINTSIQLITLDCYSYLQKLHSYIGTHSNECLPPEVFQWWLHPDQWFSTEQLWELLPWHSGQWIQVGLLPLCRLLLLYSDRWWIIVQVWYRSSGRQHGSGNIVYLCLVSSAEVPHHSLFFYIERLWGTFDEQSG